MGNAVLWHRPYVLTRTQKSELYRDLQMKIQETVILEYYDQLYLCVLEDPDINTTGSDMY